MSFPVLCGHITKGAFIIFARGVGLGGGGLAKIRGVAHQNFQQQNGRSLKIIAEAGG